MRADTRYEELDMARGMAVIAMVAYHLAFDLDYFGIIDIAVTEGAWKVFARSIAITFLLIVGIALHIYQARHPLAPYRGYLSRGMKIAAYGLGITLTTLLVVPREFIFFGILHLIGVSVMLAPWLFWLRWWNLPLGAALIAFGLYANKTIVLGTPWLAWLGPPYYGMATLDWFPLLPWFGVVLLGLAIGGFLYPDGKARWQMGEAGMAGKAMAWVGRRSLMVYLVHQPTLILIILAVTGKLIEFI